MVHRVRRLVDLEVLAKEPCRRERLPEPAHGLVPVLHPAGRRAHRARVPGADLLASRVHVAGGAPGVDEVAYGAALQRVFRTEDREREEARERRHRLLRLVQAGNVAPVTLRQVPFQTVGDGAEVRRVHGVRREQVARVRRRAQRVDRAHRGHERVIARGAEALEVAALADVSVAVRVLVHPVVAEEPRALVDDRVALLREMDTVAPVQPLLPRALGDRRHVEDVVHPLAGDGPLAPTVLHRLPVPARPVLHERLLPAVAVARERRAERGEAVVRLVPSGGEVPRRGKSLVHVHLVEAEVESLPVRVEDAHGEAPRRRVDAQVVAGHVPEALQVAVGQGYGRLAPVPRPLGVVRGAERGIVARHAGKGAHRVRIRDEERARLRRPGRKRERRVRAVDRGLPLLHAVAVRGVRPRADVSVRAPRADDPLVPRGVVANAHRHSERTFRAR